YTPDVKDYCAYAASYTRLLMSLCGCAAMMYGGVIGRLARSIVPLEEVLRGLTEDVTVDGLCLWDRVSQYAYWCDDLTLQEIDLLCGVYHISTGLFFLSSWWPRPWATDTSGFNVRWWTPLWKTWFQRCLKGIQADPPATILTHGDWKHRLKQEKKCLPYVEDAEKIAAEILSVLVP
ncbi:hypothetical protein B0H16DRAFT_1334732, partial [Mycena metata]